MPLKTELNLKDDPRPPAPAPDTLPPGQSLDFDPEHLLLQLADERSRARRREAVFGSIILHLLLIILILVDPKLFRSHPHAYVFNPERLQPNQKLTYLELPPNLKIPKPRKPVHSNVISNRSLQIHQHHRVLSSLAAPRLAPPRPPAPKLLAENRPSAPPPRPSGPPAPRPGKPAAGKGHQGKIRLRNVPRENSPMLDLPGMSVADQLRAAMRAVARERVQGGGQSAATTGQLPAPPTGAPGGGNGQVGDAVQILTNTQGVDFSSYLQRIVHEVRINWYAVMPEEAYLGMKGRVVIIFEIERNGAVPGLQLISPSGTQSFDHAALAAISASNPFPPLPKQFRGPHIRLQFSFFYNLLPQQY